MSETAVLEVINHAVTDEDYHQSLFTEPGEIWGHNIFFGDLCVKAKT